MRTRLSDAMKTAMKAKDTHTLSTIRLILAALKDRDIAARAKGNQDGISDDDILSLLQAMIKQRHDSIEMYEKGGRLELAEQEAGEIEIIKQFMPEQMDDATMAAAIDAMVAEIGAASLKDMGKVMARLKELHAGKMDFSKASAIVKGRLG
ncbi:MAG: GatB/YqeY domain-containing protein [Rhodospirillaceae bacterium]|nr:GatB/YqeY domain-containing protein [Rhodospirillaceae bacterium]